MKPFLKWAGNKYRIIKRIQGTLPEGKRLIEPFLGSGAVFLNTDYSKYLLCDNNKDLISLYKILQKEGKDFINDCSKLFTPRYNNSEVYYRLRDEFNKIKDEHRKAALFLYFNRHGYNGLCRYNAGGGFNVPFGRYNKPYFPEKEMLFFQQKARRAKFRHSSFEDVFTKVRKGDVIYCDPPYVPLSMSANFTSYSAGGFTLKQQQCLADIAQKISSKGIPVLISNHHTPFTRKAYNKASQVEHFDVRRFISCNGSKRGKVNEVLALFG